MQDDEYNEISIPHGVISIMADKDISILAAWRIYRGMSRSDAAEKTGITRSALLQIEKKAAVRKIKPVSNSQPFINVKLPG